MKITFNIPGTVWDAAGLDENPIRQEHLDIEDALDNAISRPHGTGIVYMVTASETAALALVDLFDDYAEKRLGRFQPQQTKNEANACARAAQNIRVALGEVDD